MGCNKCGVANQMAVCTGCGNQCCMTCGFDVCGRKWRAANVCQACQKSNPWKRI